MSGRAPGIPVKANVVLTIVFVTAGFVFWIGLPLWLLPRSENWAWVLVPIIIATPTQWALIHEAVHGVLLPDRTANDRFGRSMAILFGAPFRVLRFGHLMHHRFSRTELEASEVRFDESRPWITVAVAHYLRILGGLYAAEAASALCAVLPRPVVARIGVAAFGPADAAGMGGPAANQLLSDAGLRELRIDGLAILGLFAVSAFLYGSDWLYLAAALLGRGFFVSLLDNAYHYGTPLGEKLYALNPALPRSAEIAMLNFNLHGVHHRHPAVPWNGLPALRRKEGVVMDENLAFAALRQFKGPIPAARLRPTAVAVRNT